MNVLTAPHAQRLFHDILSVIAFEQSLEDATRWRDKILGTIATLETFPNSGTITPDHCLLDTLANRESLRQTLCLPYRIVYECVDDEVHILSIRHSRMMVRTEDTVWH